MSRQLPFGLDTSWSSSPSPPRWPLLWCATLAGSSSPRPWIHSHRVSSVTSDTRTRHRPSRVI